MTWLLRRYADTAAHPTLPDDLHELYLLRADQRGRVYASALYLVDVLSICLRRNLRRVDDEPNYSQARGPIMLNHFAHVAIRTMNRNAGHTVINILGLALGLACCLLIARYVAFELSYDRHHTNADRIFRIVTTEEWPEQMRVSAGSAPPLAKLLPAIYPEVEAATRVARREGIGEVGDFRARETRLYAVDADFLTMFDVPMRLGDPATALADPNGIVLTEATAQRYFGDANPVGQTFRLTYEGTHDYVVTGVARAFPENSHFQFDFLTSMQYLEALFEGELDDAWRPFVPTYVLLRDAEAAEGLTAQFPDLVATRFNNPVKEQTTLSLQPLTDIHLHSALLSELEPNSSIGYIYLFGGIAALILLIACINFMNLATSRSMRRAKEVGMRKALGAHRASLMAQFLGETLLLTYAALLLALALAALALPTFNMLVGRELLLFGADPLPTLGVLLGAGLVVGVLAGSYPAFYLSAFQPVRVLKGLRTVSRRSLRLREALVVVQFGITIVLLIGMLVMYEQLTFMQQKPLGYETEQLVYMTTPQRRTPTDVPAYERTLKAVPGVVSVTAASVVPGSSATDYATYMPSRSATMPPEERVDLRLFFVEGTFGSTYQFEFVHGRDFSPAVPTDSLQGFVINERAMHALGLTDDPVGQPITFYRGDTGFHTGYVIGVVRDFHFASLHTPIEPVIWTFRPVHTRSYLIARIRTDDLPTTLAGLEAAWTTVAPEWPLEVQFLDDTVRQLYEEERRIGRIIAAFTVLAILIACLGLFGLASFAAEQRTKEVGVRKVLGASSYRVVALLLSDFVRLVVVAAVLALPVAYFVMDRWLQDFAYRIDIGWTTLLGGCVLALLIALTATGYQAIRASLTNPADALRYE